MSELDRLFAANQAYVGRHAALAESRPQRHLAVVTCMDTRIDPLAVLGLQLGEAHVIRNAGARVTDDVLRSLALSSHALGVDTVVVMQHTNCGVAGTSDEELRRRTGADIDFHAIADHTTALREDIERLAGAAYLNLVQEMAGVLFDVDSGAITDVVRWERT